jgi:hypothetical protein
MKRSMTQSMILREKSVNEKIAKTTEEEEVREWEDLARKIRKRGQSKSVGSIVGGKSQDIEGQYKELRIER